MYEVRKTQTYATCGGTASHCDTYKDHPEWEKMKRMRRHIPPGEMAFFIEGTSGCCLCYKHAPQAIARLKKEILNSEAVAAAEGWEQK